MTRLKKFWLYCRLAIIVLRLNQNPENTKLVFQIGDTLYRLGTGQELRRILQADSASLNLIQEKKVLQDYSLQSLLQLPTGTLGHAYAQHMITNNLDPDFYPRPREITDQTYVFLRMRQTHDLWHVVTGYDTSIRGEISLQSFMLAQVASPLSIILISMSLLRCAFQQQESLFPLMDGITSGWLLGRKARLLFAYDWSSAWSKELQSVRQELQI